MITTEEAASLLGVSKRRVQAMLKNGVLLGEKVSGVWLVDEASALNRKRNPVPAGHPRKSEKAERYTLMRRNNPVFDFTCSPDDYTVIAIGEVHDKESVPIGTGAGPGRPSIACFREWMDARKIPDTRRNLNRYLLEGGGRNTAHLMFKTLGLTLVDQYWFKPEGFEGLDWHDVNPFENDYSHAKLYDPGNSTSGMLEKFWEKREGADILLKCGNVQNREPYNEVLSTQLLRRMLPPGEFTEYWLEHRDGKTYSACRGFVTPGTELVAMADVMRTYSRRTQTSTYLAYRDICEAQGIEDVRSGLAKMMVFDFLTGNHDRHQHNLGILRDSHTGEWIRLAPIFDNGAAFYLNEMRAEALNAGMYFYASNPFSEYPSTQLSLVEDFSWFEPSLLRDFREVIAAAFEGNDAVSDELVDAIANQFERRLDRVLEVAAEREPMRFSAGGTSGR